MLYATVRVSLPQAARYFHSSNTVGLEQLAGILQMLLVLIFQPASLALTQPLNCVHQL